MEWAQFVEKAGVIGEQANAAVRWAELLKENSRLEHEKSVAILALILQTQGGGQPGSKPAEIGQGADKGRQPSDRLG